MRRPAGKPARLRSDDWVARSSSASERVIGVAVYIILAALVIAAVFVIGYAMGRSHRKAPAAAPMPERPPLTVDDSDMARAIDRSLPGAATELGRETSARVDAPPLVIARAPDGAIAERARVIRSFEAETALLRRAQIALEAPLVQLSGFAEERRRLHSDLAAARGETARYRQLVVDLENNAPPPFFGAESPDDLKLIVGVGPVLERMLQQLGVATYRQIARWSERDVDEFDAKLHEFPGRIRRDAWVTQARALHQSKYGEALPSRNRQ